MGDCFNDINDAYASGLLTYKLKTEEEKEKEREELQYLMDTVQSAFPRKKLIWKYMGVKMIVPFYSRTIEVSFYNYNDETIKRMISELSQKLLEAEEWERQFGKLKK